MNLTSMIIYITPHITLCAWPVSHVIPLCICDNTIGNNLITMCFCTYRKLRKSDAGKMVISIAVALMCHQLSLLPANIISTASITEDEPVALCFWNAVLSSYFGSVLVFLFAAEAVNMFFKIVLVFKKIHYYVLKASLVAWSKFV